VNHHIEHRAQETQSRFVPFLPALVPLFVLAAVLFLGVSSAQAKQARLFSGSFGAATSMVPDPYPLSSFGSVAVDGSAGPSRGDVYVTDGGNNRVEKFDSSGHLVLMFGKAVNKTKVEEGRPEAEQNVCLATETCQPGMAAGTPGAFQGFLLRVAVDSSAGSSAGDIYVGETSWELGGRQGLDRVTKFDETGHIISSWGSGGVLDGASIPEGPFFVVSGVAVDSSGNLWVLDNRKATGEAAQTIRASEFKQDSSLLTSWHAPGNNSFQAPEAFAIAPFAIDSADNLYIMEGPGSEALSVWSSSGTRIGAVTSPVVDPDTGERETNGSGFEPYAVALDPASGDIYQAGPFPAFSFSSPPIIRRFAAASCKPSGEEHLCSTSESFGLGRLRQRGVAGLAVDSSTPSDPVYAASGTFTTGEVISFSVETVPDVVTAKASSLTGASARLNGTVNPSGLPLTKCFFEWGEGEGSYEHEAPCEAPDATGVGSGGSPVEVHAQISGLTAGKTYHFRLVASNANTDLAEESSRGQDLAFGPPRVLGTSPLGVSATSATLQSELNAVNVETSYHFEYDTAPYAEGEGPHGTSIPLPDASTGSGGAAVTGSALVGGLAPATVYHYRVVATNTLGTVTGPDRSFTTQSAISGEPLLDGRVWEMVSPPQKSGSSIHGLGSGLDPKGVLQASVDGDGIAFLANGPFGQEAPSNRSLESSQFLAFRGTNGWSTKDVTTPREDVVGYIPGNLSGYKAFSQDLSFGAVQPRGVTPLSPLATATTPYLRAASGEFLPLVDSLNVPPETVFDGKVGSNGLVVNEPQFEGGSPDLHSVVIASCFKLTEDAVNSCGKDVQSLYLWHEGGLRLASVLPNEKPAALTGGQADLGGKDLKRDVVSNDGTRLVFTAFLGRHLYLRDVALGKTVQLDQPDPGAAGGGDEPQFEDMSADGSKVLFTDPARLTGGSEADNSHRDLYMCEIVVQGGALTCVLKDLSVSRNASEAGSVLGATLGSDSSGRYVYFAANGVLAPGAAPGDCNPQGGNDTGGCGLYLLDTVAGTVKLVTTLSDTDYRDWAPDGLDRSTARVSPNGRFLAFMSQRSLTGYDNRDAVSGQQDMEVFLYDRLGDGGEGRLVCASCNPTGARPHGVEIVDDAHSLLNEEGIWSGGTWLAAAIPGWTPFTLLQTFYQSRYLSDSGRLFFNSPDALVPRDSNGTVDVYEYEPPRGEGQPASNSCSVSSATYSPSSGGCVDLVSSGTSAEESAFLDASESGDDVFLLTAAQLVPADADTANDIYDARVGGVVVEPVKPPGCEGDACQNPVSAPEDPTPGSLTFKGPGNPLAPVPAVVKGKAKPSGRAVRLSRALKACARKPKRKRAACERQARRTYGPVGKAKKSNGGAHR
jgi:hypothetical protein